MAKLFYSFDLLASDLYLCAILSRWHLWSIIGGPASITSGSQSSVCNEVSASHQPMGTERSQRSQFGPRGSLLPEKCPKAHHVAVEKLVSARSEDYRQWSFSIFRWLMFPRVNVHPWRCAGCSRSPSYLCICQDAGVSPSDILAQYAWPTP